MRKSNGRARRRAAVIILVFAALGGAVAGTQAAFAEVIWSSPASP